MFDLIMAELYTKQEARCDSTRSNVNKSKQFSESW